MKQCFRPKSFGPATVRSALGRKARMAHNAPSTTRRRTAVARDDFGTAIKEALAKRVAYRCSKPECRSLTIGPHAQPARVVNVGVAAHVSAASPKGPRFDPSQTQDERRGLDNAIWLCQTCAKLVDSDVDTYPAARLRAWKIQAEAETLRSLNGGAGEDVYPRPGTSLHSPVPRIAEQVLEVLAQLLEAYRAHPGVARAALGAIPSVPGGQRAPGGVVAVGTRVGRRRRPRRRLGRGPCAALRCGGRVR